MSHLGKLIPSRVDSLAKCSDYSLFRNLEMLQWYTWGFIMSEIILRETSSLVVTSSLGSYSNIKKKIKYLCNCNEKRLGDSQLITMWFSTIL